MRRPDTIEKLYLDFDGFFASVMQQAIPALRGLPIGVIPFDVQGRQADSTVIIACSKEAKTFGVKNVMPVPDARACCPELILVPQQPDLFRRANATLLNEINCEIPIEAIKSIDEMTCGLDGGDIAAPHDLAGRIKARIAKNVGPYITCSIGMAANRLLAKIACKVNKPNGITIWKPASMPGPLLTRPMSDVPGIGSSMQHRLAAAGITTMPQLWDSQPKHLRAIWGNVNGERMWYAIHGYALHAMPTERSMFGHSRVLPPELRNLSKARECSRLLLTKAARRMRRGGFRANSLSLWLSLSEDGWGKSCDLPAVMDDMAIQRALDGLWRRAMSDLPSKSKAYVVSTALGGLSDISMRQGDLLLDDDRERRRSERITNTIDGLNAKFGKRVVTIGPWSDLALAGGKIAYNRIPSAEDFW
ncbi:MAG: type VI secretion protein ImpB [Alphaproteobacteria bacterium]|nr:type VI secretion protein ImpB [Alphaproteobacteria bacterium]